MPALGLLSCSASQCRPGAREGGCYLLRARDRTPSQQRLGQELSKKKTLPGFADYHRFLPRLNVCAQARPHCHLQCSTFPPDLPAENTHTHPPRELFFFFFFFLFILENCPDCFQHGLPHFGSLLGRRAFPEGGRRAGGALCMEGRRSLTADPLPSMLSRGG